MTKAPKHLSPQGKRWWREIARDYHIEDPAGLALLTTAAECLDRRREAQAAIIEHGVVVKTATGGIKGNPAVQVEKDQLTGFLAAMRQLNLDIEPLRDHPGRPPK